MSWVAVAVGVGTAVAGYASSRQSANAAKDAASTAASGEERRQQYLEESQALPMHYRDQALGLLASEFGLAPPPSSDPVSQQFQLEQIENPNAYMSVGGRLVRRAGEPEFITQEVPIEGEYIPVQQEAQPSIVDIAKRSPLYEAMLSTRGAGEEAILRSASVTGGLRGGASVSDLVDYNTQLENQALLSSYQNVLSGLGSFTGYQGFAPEIAQSYATQGSITGAGNVAAAQATQQGYGAIAQGLGSALSAYTNRPQTTTGTGVSTSNYDYSGYV